MSNDFCDLCRFGPSSIVEQINILSDFCHKELEEELIEEVYSTFHWSLGARLQTGDFSVAICKILLARIHNGLQRKIGSPFVYEEEDTTKLNREIFLHGCLERLHEVVNLLPLRIQVFHG